MPYQFSSRRPHVFLLLLFCSFQYITDPNEAKITSIPAFLIKRNTLLLFSFAYERYTNSGPLAAHSPPRILSMPMEREFKILFYQHSCVTPSRVSSPSVSQTEQTHRLSQAPPCHFDFDSERRGSVRHSGPEQLAIRSAMWLSSSCQAVQKTSSLRGKPAMCLRDTVAVVPPGSRPLSPFVPLRIQTRGLAGDAHSALSPDHVAAPS